jgi:hypothetical protein
VVHQAFAPGTSKTVGDDDRNGEARALLEFAMEFAGGAVGIFGEQQGVASAVDVRDVDAAVRAEEAVMGLGDEHSIFAADYGAALLQG